MNGSYSMSVGPLRDFNKKCQNFNGFSSDESSLMITINVSIQTVLTGGLYLINYCTITIPSIPILSSTMSSQSIWLP